MNGNTTRGESQFSRGAGWDHNGGPGPPGSRAKPAVDAYFLASTIKSLDFALEKVAP